MEKYSCKTMILSGAGAVSALGEMGGKRLFLVTDPFFMKNGMAMKVAQAAKAEKILPLLTDEELETLKSEFPQDYEERIERLSEYIASKGARYKNHLATIRSWDRRERREREQRFRQENYETEDTL